MKEKFDREFAKKIKEVFSSQNHVYETGEWEKFRQTKLKKESRKTGPAVWIGRAASIVLLLSLISFFYYSSNNNIIEQQAFQEITVKQQSYIKTEMDTLRSSAISNNLEDIDKVINDNNANVKTKGKESLNNLSITMKDPEKEVEIESAETVINQRSSNKELSFQIVKKSPSKKSINKDLTLSVLKNTYPATAIKGIPFIDMDKAVFKDIHSKNILLIPEADKTNTSPKYYLPNERLTFKTQDTLLFNPASSLTIAELTPIIEDKKENKNRPVSLGIVLSSAMSHSDNDYGSGLNIGGGVLSQIPISGKLDVYTGLMLSSKSLSIRYGTDFTTGKHLSAKELNYVGVDVPLNLKYNFYWQKNRQLYLSAGLSSLAYLKENYSASYQTKEQIKIISLAEGGQEMVTYKLVSTNSIETETQSAFSTFDLAKLLNVSVGIEYPMKNGLLLIVEPYYKYPLGTLTSEKVRIGYGGLNLRLNFVTFTRNKIY